MKVYGLKNCDTTRKALKYLREGGAPAEIHDLRADGLSAQKLREWIKILGWETMLNRRGTTWRGLSEAEKENLTQSKAVDLMLKYPALIKRPIVEGKKGPTLGFKDIQSKF
jgi:arsenate reductase